MDRTIIIAIIAAILGLAIGYGLTNRDSFLPGKQNSTTPTPSTSSPSGTTLDLSNTGLTKVTSDIYERRGIVTLILSNNSLKTLPSDMGRLTGLQTLKLDHNQLEGSLIGEIRMMQDLRVLDASYNNMTGIPAEIGQLKKLQTLDYSHNNIDTLPNELFNLKDLKTLNFTGNPFPQSKIDELRSRLPNTTIVF